ncbi:MAG TPA: CoA transferase [Jatrophihabitantaceae bacterium]|nr:CoA transferase [Jatrophihabitantaceae bacterium]
MPTESQLPVEKLPPATPATPATPSAPSAPSAPATPATPSAPAAGFRLLEGVRVLDLTTSIAGPYATLLLADLGADVVKVERAGRGDDSRGWGPPFLNGDALWYLAVNRNKRSIGVDFARADDRELLQQLMAAADVLLTTYRQPLLERLGLDYPAVASRRSDLIYCTITGYGLTGPNHALPGYDLIAEGVSGIMDLTGEAESGPQKIGAPAADILAGMDAAFAVVAALFDRQRGGSGHQIDISLVESMTRILAPKIVSYLGSGEAQRRTGGKDSVISIYQVFDTADVPITLALGNDGIFGRFCAVVGRDDIAADARFRSNLGRREHRAELVGQIQQILCRRRSVEWLQLFSDADIPAGPINNLEAVVTDPHLLARGMFYRVGDGPDAIPQVNTGWHLDGAANSPRSRPPRLAEHNEDVKRAWLPDSPNQESQEDGFDDRQINR